MKFRNLAMFVTKTRKYCIILNNLKQGYRIYKWQGSLIKCIPYYDDTRHGIMYNLQPSLIYIDVYNRGQMRKCIIYSTQHNCITYYQKKVNNLIHGIEYTCAIVGMKKTQSFINYKDGIRNGISKVYATIGTMSRLLSVSYYDDDERDPTVEYFYSNGQLNIIIMYNPLFNEYKEYRRKK